MTTERGTYLRLLLALAVGGVVLSLAFDWGWVPLFPSAGLLLAGAAAMLAGSSGRHGVAGPAVRSRLLRLLVPYWLFAAVAVSVQASRDGVSWDDAWRWVLPLRPPSDAEPWAAGLPVVSVWFWLLLLSPPLLWLARRWPLRVMAVPVLVLAPISIGLVTGSGAAHDVLIALCTFGCCWVLGFLYADGRLTRVPVGLVLAVGAAAVALGLWVADVQGEQYAADDVRDVPLAALLLGTGGVLLLLRAQPAFAWLARWRPAVAVLRFLTDRVVTAVLWAGPAVAAAPLVVDALGLEHRLWPTAAWVLLLVAVVVLGWAERLGELRIGRRRALRSPVYRFEDNVVAGQSVQSSS